MPPPTRAVEAGTGIVGSAASGGLGAAWSGVIASAVVSLVMGSVILGLYRCRREGQRNLFGDATSDGRFVISSDKIRVVARQPKGDLRASFGSSAHQGAHAAPVPDDQHELTTEGSSPCSERSIGVPISVEASAAAVASTSAPRSKPRAGPLQWMGGRRETRAMQASTKAETAAPPSSAPHTIPTRERANSSVASMGLTFVAGLGWMSAQAARKLGPRQGVNGREGRAAARAQALYANALCSNEV